MAIDLYGEEYESLSEYSKKLVKLESQRPSYKVRVNSISYYPHSGLSISLIDDVTKQELKESSYSPGIYSVWDGVPNKSNCLYVGGTNYCIRQRVYRFMKELFDLSRDDEDHPAAKKCRRMGQDPHNIYVKFIPRDEFPIITNANAMIQEIKLELIVDEYMAKELKARYNRKTKV